MFPNPRERPLPVPVASSTSGHGTRMEDPVVHDIEEHEIVDDDDDDDDDELSSHPAIHIKSREFTISIQSLTINYR